MLLLPALVPDIYPRTRLGLLSPLEENVISLLPKLLFHGPEVYGMLRIGLPRQIFRLAVLT